MTVTIRPKLTQSLLEFAFVAALWIAGVLISSTPDLLLKTFGIIVPLIIPAVLVALISLSKIVLTDDGYFRWTIAGFERARFSSSDVVRHDDGYLFMAAARGLGAGRAFIVQYRDGGKSKEIRLSTKLYYKDDIEKLKSFFEKHGKKG